MGANCTWAWAAADHVEHLVAARGLEIDTSVGILSEQVVRRGRGGLRQGSFFAPLSSTDQLCQADSQGANGV